MARPFNADDLQPGGKAVREWPEIEGVVTNGRQAYNGLALTLAMNRQADTIHRDESRLANHGPWTPIWVIFLSLCKN